MKMNLFQKIKNFFTIGRSRLRDIPTMPTQTRDASHHVGHSVILRRHHESRYDPHQSAQEKERRVRQMERGLLHFPKHHRNA